MIFALTLMPLMAGAGVAIDMVRMSQTRTILQNAADSAAIAGATSKDQSDAALEVKVRDYLAVNNAREVLEHVTKINQTLDAEVGTFTVEIAGTIPGSLMSLFGFSNLTVNTKSVANIGSGLLEVALVLDNTGSMSGTKIQNLKTAATNLVNIIHQDKADYAVVKMAVVPFAEYVNVGLANAGSSWIDMSTAFPGVWAGCVGSRPAPNHLNISLASGSYPALSGVPCNSTVLPLTTNMTAVKSAINAMTATGWTYIPTGLLWGWNVLDPAAPFAEGATKTQIKRARGQKVIVLMTDGENTISANYPFHNGTNVGVANSTLKKTCESVKDDGVTIYAVSFMVPTMAIKNILEHCATTKNKYFDAANGTELNAAFKQIAQELAAVRLTQ